MEVPVPDSFLHIVENIIPLAVYILAIVIFAIFVFSFYRFFSKKNMFELNLTQYNTSRHPFLSKIYHSLLYLVEYVLLFPLVTFAWFLLISISIGVVTENNDPNSVFFVAMALAGAIRMSSYYTEQLAQELAKTLPLALLGIFLVQSDITSYSGSLDIIKALPEYASKLLYYFVFIVLLEFSLRITHSMRFIVRKKTSFIREKSSEDFDDTH